HLRKKGKVHVLAGNSCTGSHKPCMPSHEFYKRNAILNTLCLVMCIIQDFARFRYRGQVAESPGNKSHVIINCFWNADYRQGVVSLPGFLKQFITAPLGSIATNSKDHIYASSDKVVNCDTNIHRTSRSTQNCSTFFMNFIN